jgi:glutathione S-transferase
MTPLRIYGVARTRAFRVLWIAKELDLDYEHVPTEIGPAGARKADYLAINPNGRLPAIDDGGFMLWESLAITLYLAKKHGRLYPRTLEGEAKAWQWSLWSVQEVDRGVNIWSLHAVRLPPADRDPQRLAEALKVLEGPFKVLDRACRPLLPPGRGLHRRRSQRCRRHQPGDRHGYAGDAARWRLARALPRPSGGARGAGLA